jgi:hypothetical protein
MISKLFIKTYNQFINFFSFSKNLQELRAKINKRIDIPEKIQALPPSHPRGFIKEFRKRRTTIGESYLRISQSIDSGDYNERLNALSLLAEHIIYSRSLKMPLNAARVQLALIKQVIKNRDNKRAQLELMHDFTISSFGHPRSIRKYLKRLDIIEVPESGNQLKDIPAAWDFHVHDNASYGKKSPANLMIDAFIKGLSELTIAHNTLTSEDAVKEVLLAGELLGIRINIAIEFSAITNGKRFHYMYILPEFKGKKKSIKKFFKKKSDDFKEFMQELHANKQSRMHNIKVLIDEFNKTHLKEINQQYSSDSSLFFQPFQFHPDDAFWQKINSRKQIGEFLIPTFKSIFEKRALAITSEYQQMVKNQHIYQKSDILSIKNEYHKIRHEYAILSPEYIRHKYFADNNQIKPESAVSSLDEIYQLAKNNHAGIKFIQPLENGLQEAINLILQNYKFLSHAEVFNLADYADNKQKDVIAFNQFIKFLNQGNKQALWILLTENNLKVNESKLDEAIKYISSNQIIPSIGSDATGSSEFAPGMGFVFKNQLPQWQQKYFSKKHNKLASEISEFVYEQSRVPKISLKKSEKPEILCLGQLQESKKNLLGDEFMEKPVLPSDAWEYFNPGIKNIFFISIGFLPAYFTVGIEYALLWFAITGFRNMFVDLISGNGLNPKLWNTNDINWTNLSNSLFWTGFSVPILGFIKNQFDLIWIWAHTGFLYEFGKFFFINISNGTYLATHNYIRGFDKQTIRANFFRSIIAWPFSVLFSPLGNAMALPSIVQAKFWSDFVASIIEGSNKFSTTLKLKDRIMAKLLPDMLSEDVETEHLAALDLIYFTKESNRAKTALKRHLILSISEKKKWHKWFNHKKEMLYTEYFYALTKYFDNENNYKELTNFIVSRYNKEQALYLINMISEHYYLFHKWLKKKGNIN